MNIKSVFKNLQYFGFFRSVRATYHIYKGSGHFVYMTASDTKPNSGNFAVLDETTLNWTWKKLSMERSISVPEAKAIVCRSNKYKSDFDVLASLYILTAMKKARVTKYDGKKLFFAVNKYVPAPK